MFQVALLSPLVHIRGYRVSHSYRESTYKQYESEFYLNSKDLEFPIKLTDILKFGKQNELQCIYKCVYLEIR